MKHRTLTFPPGDLNTFQNYQDFLVFSKTLFELEPDEYRGLYHVLLKLQSIGEDPLKTMLRWKKHTCGKDCSEFIRFMIRVNGMDIGQLKKSA